MRQQRTIASEKEMLLRELQHRVKNSMGIISSIVSIESKGAVETAAREALSRLGSRIEALSDLYDTLYDTGATDSVELRDYLGRVVESAAESMGSDARGIAFDHSIDPCPIDLKRAVSLGLIVNELVTDSIKHAFPGGRAGRIGVRLECALGRLRLTIADDGIGLPPDRDPASKPKGFGLNLVELLAKQLGGEIGSETGFKNARSARARRSNGMRSNRS
jgi:two-component sensor histidine kinase